MLFVNFQTEPFNHFKEPAVDWSLYLTWVKILYMSICMMNCWLVLIYHLLTANTKICLEISQIFNALIYDTYNHSLILLYSAHCEIREFDWLRSNQVTLLQVTTVTYKLLNVIMRKSENKRSESIRLGRYSLSL